MGAVVWVAAGVTTLGFLVCHHMVRAHRPSRPVPDGGTLGPYAYAYLVGGPGRTALTTLTALHRAGLITVVEKRIVRSDAPALSVDDGGGRALDPVETAAWASCRPGHGAPGPRTEDRVARSRAVRRLGVLLAEEGLLAHPRRAVRREGWEGAAALAGFSTVPICLVALAAWASGDHPDAGWVASVSPAFGLLSLLSRRFARFRPERLTEAGNRLVRDVSPGDPGTDRALYEVAAEGAGTAVPEDLRRALRRPDPSYAGNNDPPGLGGAGL
ncbi:MULTISPECIES: TIGR04222 domain-containing membrane protein [unclassified Streptomyces]|uniref:TIGR04222 domain-containing membrane protein n=1 Tax=unclassified Streptomyces TaxID=2593676 RepID=UPI0033B261D0